MRTRVGRFLVFHTGKLPEGRVRKTLRRMGRKILFGKKRPASTLIGL